MLTVLPGANSSRGDPVDDGSAMQQLRKCCQANGTTNRHIDDLTPSLALSLSLSHTHTRICRIAEQDVVTSLRDKLCLSAEEHFSLVLEHVKSLKRNKLTLLDPQETLARVSGPRTHTHTYDTGTQSGGLIHTYQVGVLTPNSMTCRSTKGGTRIGRHRLLADIAIDVAPILMYVSECLA